MHDDDDDHELSRNNGENLVALSCMAAQRFRRRRNDGVRVKSERDFFPFFGKFEHCLNSERTNKACPEVRRWHPIVALLE